MTTRIRQICTTCVCASGLVLLPQGLVAQQPGGAGQQSSPQSQGTGQQSPNSQTDQMQRDRDMQHMDTGTKQMSKSGDANFAMKAAQGGMAEVKIGQLAAEKASDPDVKAFGQQMVDDHMKANEQLKGIAKDENMTLPSDIGKHQATYDRLSAMSGADFDKAYVKAMVKDHEEDVKEFTHESQKGKDDKLKSFASETLPTLQSHLDKVKGINSKMGSGSGATK